MGRNRNQQDDRERLRYSEVLRMAHEKYTHGLNISATLEQIPTEENGNKAVSSAVVVGFRELSNGDVIEERWTEWGDADPTNVGRMIVPHIPRMSNTRAKARALRDAVNRGEATLEELGGGEEDDARDYGQSESRPAPEDSGAVQGGARPQASPNNPITEGQKNYLRGLVNDLGMTPDDFIGEFGRTNEMNAARASEVIQTLNQRKREASPGG